MSRRNHVAAAAALAAAAIGLTLAGPLQDRDTRPCLPHTLELTDAARSGAPPAAGIVLVANQFSGTASLIELATGTVTTLDTGTEPHDAAISPDGRWGIVSNYGPGSPGRFMGNRLFVIDIAHRRVARMIETGEYRGLHDVAFRPGFPTRALVTAQTGQHIIEVDVVTGDIVTAVETRGDRSHHLAVTRDGRTVFTTNEGSATISRLDLEARRHERSLPASMNVEGMVVTTDGRELWVGENAMGMVRVRDAGTGEIRAAFEGFRYPNRIAITPDGARVIISDPGCRAIVVADPATRSIVRVIRTPGAVMVGDAAPGGRIAFASVPGDRRVVAIDLLTGRVVARYRAGRAPDGLSWGPLPAAGATIAR